MIDLPQPKIGIVSSVTINSADLDQSLNYYRQLGFAECARNDYPFPWVQITDGALLIMLRQHKDPQCSLSYYCDDLDAVVEELEHQGIVFSQKPAETEMIRRFVMQSPDGLTITLVTYVDIFKQPAGPTMLTMAQEDWFDPEKYVNPICGIFGEFAHPVVDLIRSIPFWEKLGFDVISSFESPYPWAIMSDGLAIIGLHQTKDFDYPVITFFAADMKQKIERLKKNGLTNFTDRGNSSLVLATPEGQHINLFKMGA